MKPIYISATVQDSGKTSVICGLFQILRERGLNPGYIKPVGQRYIQYEGNNIDEDAVLMYEAFDLGDSPKHMSPIAIEPGFTSHFIFNPDVSPLEKSIMESVQVLLNAHPMLIVEGTGHAGVGSCFGLSNARVAQLLGADAIIVTEGGIGKPIDEVALSLALFRQFNVNVKGVILNKVIPEKLSKIQTIAGKGLENLGTKLIGTIPYEATLTFYTLRQIAEEFKYDVLCGEENLGNTIEHTVVAAMAPQHVLSYIKNHSAIITPGDRIDNILLALALSESKDFHDRLCSGGLILTGGLKPDLTILSLLKASNIPVLIAKEDTFKVSARMKDLAFKIQSFDHEKIAKTHSLVQKNVDTELLLA